LIGPFNFRNFTGLILEIGLKLDLNSVIAALLESRTHVETGKEVSVDRKAAKFTCRQK